MREVDDAAVMELNTVTDVEVVGVVDKEVVVGENVRLVLELDEMLKTLDEALTVPGLDMLDGLATVAPDEVGMLEDTLVVALDVGLLIVLVLLVEVSVEVEMLVLDVVVLALAEVLELPLELLAMPDEVIVFDVEV